MSHLVHKLMGNFTGMKKQIIEQKTQMKTR